MRNKTLNRLLVYENASIKEAMKKIDRGVLGIAFVVDKQKRLLGAVTDGDIRRAILKGVNLIKPIKDIANKKPIFIQGKVTEKEITRLKNNKSIKKIMLPYGSLKIPVIDEKGNIEDILFFYDNKRQSLLSSQKKASLSNEAIKKVLLVGGAGYLGSILSRKLLAKGYKVRVLDNLTYGDEGIRELYENGNFEFFNGDIRDISKVIEAIKGMDAVMHLAAIVGDPACALDPKATIEVNYLATKAIAEACKYNQINKFLFTSTCSVYGASKNTKDRLHEESPLNPVSLYAETKLKSEEGILSLADENFSPTIFRFGTLYGVSPRMRFDLVINTLSAKAAAENKITIFGGNQWRPNLEVSDAAEACILWLSSSIKKSGGAILNVGGNEQNCKIVQIGEMVKKAMPQITLEIKEEANDLRDYNVSFDKIARILNFKPQKTIEQAIQEIKVLVESEKIDNFNDSKYNNYRFLSG